MSSKMASEAEVTVVVVGDARVGKTALIRRVTQGEFSQVRRRIGSHNIQLDIFIIILLFCCFSPPTLSHFRDGRTEKEKTSNEHFHLSV